MRFGNSFFKYPSLYVIFGNYIEFEQKFSSRLFYYDINCLTLEDQI